MNRTLISFSGGRTSALMTKLLVQSDRPGEAVVVFANTGQEDERTLEFVEKVRVEWGIHIVWVEAVVHPTRGKGTTHRIVDFRTATRDGSIFEAMIAKFGIPNKNYSHCTRELKLRPITSFVRAIGWKAGTYDTAIGIRADEMDRVYYDYKALRLCYPLLDAKIKKEDVIAFWKDQPFDLDLPEHRGNCVWCWKKSLRKHLTLASETPEVFDFPKRMEAEYAAAGAGVGNRVFFRNSRSAIDLLELAKQPFEKFIDPNFLDVGGSCSESCEVFGEDTTEADVADLAHDR